MAPSAVRLGSVQKTLLLPLWGRAVGLANRRVLESTGMDAGAALRWGIERPVEIAGWDPRIEVLETYPMFHGLRSRLAWRAGVGTLLSDALNIMSMVRLRFRA